MAAAEYYRANAEGDIIRWEDKIIHEDSYSACGAMIHIWLFDDELRSAEPTKSTLSSHDMSS